MLERESSGAEEAGLERGELRRGRDVRVEVAEPDAPIPSPLRDSAQRKRLVAWIGDLNSPDAGKRDSAEKGVPVRVRKRSGLHLRGDV